MNLKSILGATALAVGLLGAAHTGHAAIIVTEGASGTGDNLVFNSCNTAVMGPSTTLTGCLNGQPNTVINLTSTSSIMVEAGGQARIVASAPGGTYSNLTIDAINPSNFSTLVLNIDATANGTVTFTGSPGGTSSSFNLSQNGNNFFTITGENFDFVSFQTFGTSINAIVVDTSQIRLDTTLTPVPEPMSLALFGAGLLGLGMVRRKQSA
jgi:hypothetical protein